MRMLRAPIALLAAMAAAPALVQSAPAPAPSAASPASSPAQRQAYFGEMHLHTTMSFDAWTGGTKTTPETAYRFAKGEAVSVNGVQARRAWPLDFMAVTDHSEWMGALSELDRPGSLFSRTEVGQRLRAAGREAFKLGASEKRQLPELTAAAAASRAWEVQIKAAKDHYQPGKFTTFVAYEWTAGGKTPGAHLHRNVFFDTDQPPIPFSADDSNRPEDLWTYLENVRKRGVGVIAVSHNANLGNGQVFDWYMSDGKPMDRAYAERRALNEPLYEIVQNKGSSDTRPELSPNDEFANFEIVERLYRDQTKAATHGAFVREAFGRGLVVESKVGANPFKFGLIGASDFHNGLSTSRENAFAGVGIDPATMLPMGEAARRSLGLGPKPPLRPTGQPEDDPVTHSSAGLTGVWAEENSRPSIFAALRRKETFATSGERIRVRMFGGWNFDPKLMASKDWVAQAYATGVPMGSDLPATAKAKAPRFAVWAMKDPDGANLDRIQIIKLSLEGDSYKEKVFDVALSGNRKVNPKTGKAAAVGNTVDLKTGAYANSIGAGQLAAVWQDPEFNPAKPAVYYARVLEIPTPRWSTLLALRNNIPLRDKAPATIQERAWSSPIWFKPRG